MRTIYDFIGEEYHFTDLSFREIDDEFFEKLIRNP